MIMIMDIVWTVTAQGLAAAQTQENDRPCPSTPRGKENGDQQIHQGTGK